VWSINSGKMESSPGDFLAQASEGSSKFLWPTGFRAVAYAENFHGGGFTQWHRVVICIWCAVLVTSQFDVIVLFPNQRFCEVC